MPADWFGRETIPLLAQYVRHIVRSKRIAEMIKRLEDQKDTASFDTKSYLKLLRAEDLQSRVLTTLATKMRISQQSTYDKSKKKPSVTGAKLWSKDY